MSREQLATLQREFVEALSGEPCVFEGVPAGRMRALSESLLRRRLKPMRLLAPALSAWLGPRFETMFRARMGTGRALDPRSDLLSFAAGLARVPEDVELELMVLRGRWAWLSARRRPVIVLRGRRIEVPIR